MFPPGTGFRVGIRRDYRRPLPRLLMQREHLSEILVNLLHNARQAMEGEGSLEVGLRFEGPCTVVATVADDGPGIDPGRLPEIFDPYFTTKETGTGLGLAIVKHSAELYGGTVEAESGAGPRNPVLGAPSRPDPAEALPMKPDLPPLLIVDDERNMRLSLETVMREEGYQALTASSAEEGLDLVPGEGAVPGDLRLPPRRDERARVPRAGPQGAARAAGAADHRLRHPASGGGGDPGRGLRLPVQALRARGAAPLGGPLRRAPPADPGEPGAAGRAAPPPWRTSSAPPGRCRTSGS